MNEASNALRERLDKIESSYQKKRLTGVFLSASSLVVFLGLYLFYNSNSEIKRMAYTAQADAAVFEQRLMSAQHEIARLRVEKAELAQQLTDLRGESPGDETVPEEVAIQNAVQTAVERIESPPQKLARPVEGRIVRSYEKGRNEGIDILSTSGSSVLAAADGVVAAITLAEDQSQILVIRHSGGLLTVYAGAVQIVVVKGDVVTRGQEIGIITDVPQPVLHFEVREGFRSVDPSQYLTEN